MMINKMMEMFGLPGGFNYIDKRVPPYDLDIYPPWCDIKQCKDRLLSHYEDSRANSLPYLIYIKRA